MDEGRIDGTEDAIEVVTIHTSKGLEWPVVIPINASTNSIGRNALSIVSRTTPCIGSGRRGAPDMAAARAEERRQDANQRERIWYVACTRARDLLILPYIPQAPEGSWLTSIDLKQSDVPGSTSALSASTGRQRNYRQTSKASKCSTPNSDG